MAELKEVFEMVTKQTEPDLDSWQQQERRQRAAARNRRIGAIAVAAAVVAGIAIAVVAARDRADQPANRPTPSIGEGALPAYASSQHLIVGGLDGTAEREVVGLPVDAHFLDLSPDGATLAFSTFAKGADHVATIGLDGEGLAILARGDEPAWSPDGSRIVFATDTGIRVMASDGSAARTVTSPGVGIDEYPRWSPDGTTIVFDTTGSHPLDESGFSPTSEIMTVPVEGGTPAKLTRNDVGDAHPDYSPDGSLLAFEEDGKIWVMNADGSDPRRLTGGCCSFTPRWSPDGSKIAYTRYDASWGRPTTSLDGIFTSHPVVVLHVIDMMRDELDVGRRGMVTDRNVPVWISAHELLIQEVDHV